ncbi:unnamed protein product, partial [Iphiclides podalirius]
MSLAKVLQKEFKDHSATEQLLAAQGASPDGLPTNGHELALFGHALDAAQNPHLSAVSNNLSGSGEGEGEESSSDAGASDAEGEPRAKQEPLDYDDPAALAHTNGALPHNFPGLLNLPGFPGLPGPSGIPDNFAINLLSIGHVSHTYRNEHEARRACTSRSVRRRVTAVGRREGASGRERGGAPNASACGKRYSSGGNPKRPQRRRRLRTRTPPRRPRTAPRPLPRSNRRLRVAGAALAGGAAIGYRPQCPLCGRVYSSTSNLRQHMLNVHSQTDRDQWFPCGHCGKRCKTKHYLINHQLQAHGIRQRQSSRPEPPCLAGAPGAQCPLCARRLRSAPAARAHLAAHYPRDSPRCPVAACARLFAHPNSVRNHMRLKHRRQWERMKTLKWGCGWTD